MLKSSRKLANKVLRDGPGGLEEIRVHVFADDEAAHDNDRVEELYSEFGVDFERVQCELSSIYGQPTWAGCEDHDDIPMNGVFHFAMWKIGDQMLFVAAAHEDREVPILLMIGTADG